MQPPSRAFGNISAVCQANLGHSTFCLAPRYPAPLCLAARCPLLCIPLPYNSLECSPLLIALQPAAYPLPCTALLYSQLPYIPPPHDAVQSTTLHPAARYLTPRWPLPCPLLPRSPLSATLESVAMHLAAMQPTASYFATLFHVSRCPAAQSLLTKELLEGI